MRITALILSILLVLTACQSKDATQTSLADQPLGSSESIEGSSIDPTQIATSLESTDATTDSSDVATGAEPSDVTPTVLEENVTFHADAEYPLQGTLLIPQGQSGPVPAVVLVHGSGPNDRDETVYDNKPFKDIAEALAQEGIAVLRYDKRTYTHPLTDAQEFAEFTVKEETIDDAIAATNLLKADARIDANRVFIIGHSLGGKLAPRIDAEGGNYAGIILLAGTPRSLVESIIDQNMALLETLSESEQRLALAQIQELQAIFDEIADMTDEDAKQVSLLGASGYYYKEMDTTHPISDYLTQLTKPILILQGERDFQVYADKDYVLYQQLLAEHENATFQLYPNLNHLFMESTSGTADEYMVPDHVDEQVLTDIIRWIKQQ